MYVPFTDLRAQHEELQCEIEGAIRSAIEQSAFVGGACVQSFERNFAAFCGVPYAVTCASGTDALRLALMAVGVRRGDEVITVPHTFAATIEAITMVGAHPMLVDIERATYGLSPPGLAEFLAAQGRPCGDGHWINVKTGRPLRAVLPVHLYGLPADMGPILKIASQYNLAVIEDACQAHGAAYRLDGTERLVGGLGQAAAFSFYPSKNLGALGEGGAVTTRDEAMARQIRIWRDHGQVEKYVHISPDGWNSRLDALQCAALDLKLSKLNEWNERRRGAATWYRERLAGDPRIVLPWEPDGRRHVYHTFVVRVPRRGRTHRQLSDQGIDARIHYPTPIHLQPAYRYMGLHPGDYPEAETAAATTLSIPLYPHITEKQVDYVCRQLKETL